MIGTPLLGAWIAHVAFWVLLVLGLTRRVIGGKSAAATVATIVRPSWNFEVSAAIAAGLALTAYVVQVALGLETRVQAHRTCAHRLWAVCERYRSLLAELQDGLIDPATLLRRRDELIQQTHAVYEHAYPTDHGAFERLRLSGGGLVNDEMIDRFLPESLRRNPPSRAA